MVKCVDCKNFDPDDFYCSYLKGGLTEEVANREYDECEGYEPRSGEGKARSGHEA